MEFSSAKRWTLPSPGHSRSLRVYVAHSTPTTTTTAGPPSTKKISLVCPLASQARRKKKKKGKNTKSPICRLIVTKNRAACAFLVWQSPSFCSALKVQGFCRLWSRFGSKTPRAEERDRRYLGCRCRPTSKLKAGEIRKIRRSTETANKLTK